MRTLRSSFTLFEMFCKRAFPTLRDKDNFAEGDDSLSKESGLKNFLSVLFSVLVRCVLQGSSLFLFPFWLKDFHLYVQHFCFWSCQTIVFAFFVVAVHFIDNSTGVCFWMCHWVWAWTFIFSFRTTFTCLVPRGELR